jgi:aryl-alcohol dehydrogenase-like predicted oxidoreductase
VSGEKVVESILDLGFSRLAVGTVQFGLPYGVANRTGQPSFKQVCEILACAVENGATTLDTAATYGESESVLGRALREIGAQDQVTIVSKVRHLKTMGQEHTPENIEHWIRGSVVSSLERLGIDSLPVCLFHDTIDVAHMDSLLALKAEGLVQHVGASLVKPDQMEMVLSTAGVEAMQIPMNMVDQRIRRSGALGKVADAGMAVFVRGVYLQGLLLMPEEEIMPVLHQVVPVRRALKDIADEAELTMAEMALRYGLSLPGVTSVLTGVETVEQMESNARIAARGSLPPEVVQAIDRAVPDLSETIILSPWLWPGAM